MVLANPTHECAVCSMTANPCTSVADIANVELQSRMCVRVCVCVCACVCVCVLMTLIACVDMAADLGAGCGCSGMDGQERSAGMSVPCG
jgi:hypothetical protein